MKKLSNLLVFCLFLIKSQAQTPQTKSVTISPTAGNIQEIKGNIKATGIIESNTLKASGLASGNSYIANPVYANLDGTLVTGYKTEYLSIPSSAFVLEDYVHYSRNDLQNTSIDHESYQVRYNAQEVEMTFKADKIFAPIQIPHKSKLSSMKLNIYTYTPTNVAIFIFAQDINIDSTPMIVYSEYTSNLAVGRHILNFNLNLHELDNSQYLYNLQILNLSYPYQNYFSVRGAIIEYQDF